MKIKILSLCSVLFAHSLCGEEQVPSQKWIEGKDVHIVEDGIYIDTNFGAMELTVIDYDEEKDRYLVEWSIPEDVYISCE